MALHTDALWQQSHPPRDLQRLIAAHARPYASGMIGNHAGKPTNTEVKMWICLSDAFLSVVAAKEKGHVMVRARNAEHLKKLFPRNKIVVTPDNDYRYRVVVRPAKVAKLMAERLEAVDYVKFKPTVTERKLHDLYLDFWFLHEQYQQDLLAHDELNEVGPVGDGEREELANDRWASTQYAD